MVLSLMRKTSLSSGENVQNVTTTHNLKGSVQQCVKSTIDVLIKGTLNVFFYIGNLYKDWKVVKRRNNYDCIDFLALFKYI